MVPQAAPPPISDGARVMVTLSRGPPLEEEGVVIEVVPPGCPVQTPDVLPRRPRPCLVHRYVVQCWSCRVLRCADQMIVLRP